MIANKDLGIKKLTQAQLANLYMGRPMGVDAKVAPVPFDQPANSAQHREFYHHILHWTAAQATNYWSSQLFSGGVSQPQTVSSDKQMVAAVYHTPGGIGYINSRASGPWLRQNMAIVYVVERHLHRTKKAKKVKKAKVVAKPVHHPALAAAAAAATVAAAPVKVTPVKVKKAAKPIQPAKVTPIKVTPIKVTPVKVKPVKKLQAVPQQTSKQLTQSKTYAHIIHPRIIHPAAQQPKPEQEHLAIHPVPLKTHPFAVPKQVAKKKLAPVKRKTGVAAHPVKLHASAVTASATPPQQSKSAPIIHVIKPEKKPAVMPVRPNHKSFDDKLSKLTAQVQKASQSLQQEALKSGAITPAQIKQAKKQALNSNDLWQVIGAHFDLGAYSNEHVVRKQVDWFLSHRSLLNKILNNATPYLYYVYQQTKRYHMPGELALLPMVESGYDPYGYSRAGATGLWQMMPATASSLGVEIDWWYDGRRDVLVSTQAALGYINSLYHHYHNWPLAIAAYDAGQGEIDAILKANAGKHMSYWSLPLPTETRTYLPKLLALAQIIKNASYFGVTLPNIPNKPYFAAVHLDSQITISQVAKLAGISEAQVQHLNPGLRRWASDPNESYTLLVPVNTVARLRRNLNRIDGHQEISWLYHEVRYGETLRSIARNYHVSESTLRKVNGLGRHDQVRAGDGLLVPLALHHRFTTKKHAKTMSVGPTPKQGFSVQPVDANNSTQIKKGDSLKTILDKLHGENY